MGPMNGQSHKQRVDRPRDVSATDGESAQAPTRREFLDAVKKAIYVTPVLLMWTPRKAQAAHLGSCLSLGRPCLEDDDCCSHICDSSGMGGEKSCA